ncbi:MAG: hypothetical protein FWB99_06905, partial [Treponema sp.]|nr:hypothetical protein [Treponema sp.]
MKKAYALLAVLCIAILAACSNPLRPGRGGEGTITIGFGAASRIAVCREDLADLTHEITLTGPGGTITRSITGHGNVSISVAPGTWNIAIRAVGDTPPGYNNGITLVEHQFPSRMLRAIGFYRAEIRAGETTPVTVGMTSAVEVSNAAQLYNAMLLARTDGADRHDDGEKVIMLAGDITGVNMQMTVAAGQNITLASNYNVAIRRTAGFIGEIFYESTGGVLRLYRSGMAGSVYVEGRPGTAANPIQVAQVAGSRLDDQLDWLRQYAASRLYYLVEISDDWELPSTSTFVPSGVTEVNITIRGIGGGASIHFGGPGSLFSVGLGLTLVLDGDLTLEGG